MSTEKLLRVDAPPDDVDLVHRVVEELWVAEPSVSAADRMAFETALIELAGNVIRHADTGTGVVCTIHLAVTDDGLTATLSDSSERGGVALTGIAMPAADAESGRGLAMVEALTDEFRYDRVDGRNRWEIVRRRTT